MRVKVRYPPPKYTQMERVKKTAPPPQTLPCASCRVEFLNQFRRPVCDVCWRACSRETRERFNQLRRSMDENRSQKYERMQRKVSAFQQVCVELAQEARQVMGIRFPVQESVEVQP